MPEFRPPLIRSRARLVLGLVLLPIGLSPILLAGHLLWGDARITYAIAGGRLTVTTGGLLDRQRSVAVREIRSVRSVEARGGRRTFGTGMPGYCVGRFSYPELGSVWQATNCGRRAVLLHLREGGRPWLLSPPDPLDFMARLSGGVPTRIELPRARSSFFARLMAPLLLGLMVLIVAVEALIVLGPRRLRYHVRDGTLEVRTLFTRRRWQLEGVRARRHRPRVTLRLLGSAMPGYYTGVFRADGKTTRVYATDLRQGVLIEGAARIFLSPADLPGFLAELRESGAVVEEQPEPAAPGE
jgi:hypothetical protein